MAASVEKIREDESRMAGESTTDVAAEKDIAYHEAKDLIIKLADVFCQLKSSISRIDGLGGQSDRSDEHFEVAISNFSLAAMSKIVNDMAKEDDPWISDQDVVGLVQNKILVIVQKIYDLRVEREKDKSAKLGLGDVVPVSTYQVRNGEDFETRQIEFREREITLEDLGDEAWLDQIIDQKNVDCCLAVYAVWKNVREIMANMSQEP